MESNPYQFTLVGILGKMSVKRVVDSRAILATVWDATAYTGRLEIYPKDELMVEIEGSVTIIDDDNRKETFKKEDSLFMPAGFTGVWKQEETMNKYFMVFDAITLPTSGIQDRADACR